MIFRKVLPEIFLFLTAFALALIGLNPSFYLDDSPEIITSSVVLGVAHPPSYPLYVLLGRLFSLLPLGAPCLRVNLLSALLGVLVCLLLYRLLREVFQLKTSLAWPFALLWMAGATAYPAALSAKNGIYQLTAVFILAVFSALLRNKTPLAFFLFGLSMANHWMSMVPCLAGFALLVLWRRGEKRISTKDLAQGAALLLLGLSLYLFLPLRSAQDPLVNWAHPVDLQNFFRHVSRYVDKNKDLTLDPLLWASQGFFYLKSAFLEFNGVGLLAVLGLWAAWRENRRRALALILAWGGLFAAICLFSKFSSARIYLTQNYSIASFIFILLFSALGFGFLSGLWTRRFPAAKVLPPLVAFLLVSGLAVGRVWTGDQAYYTYTYDYVLNAWRSVPRGGLFFCKGDVLDFPSWYLQTIAGRRPDLAVLGGGSLPMDWYRMFLARTQPGLKVPYPFHEKGKEYISGHIFKWMVDQNPGRRLFFTFPDLREDGLADLRLVPNGLTQEGFPSGVKPPFDEARAEGLWRDMRLRHFKKPDDSVDEVSWDYFLKDYGMARLWMAGWYMDQAILSTPTAAIPSPHTMGLVKDLYRKALPHLLWAQAWDPKNSQNSVNVGLDYFRIGDWKEASEWMAKAALIDPMNVDAYYYGGLIAYQMGDRVKAFELFQKTLELDPKNAMARQWLQNLNRTAPDHIPANKT